ncbi:MotA/TolQ/ExbB proton channel family protein [Tautonia plasticadhaerens]|uniref:MotA/TolQ/ExbB proton channel family protein n=1 Tax=Tautonia plasticadhaerens TaxID=2527974 RepID=UPI001E2959C7|nr:MotA/TolQ/ExbB proton channel family protein [Tautonia plasticadhaerens]
MDLPVPRLPRSRTGRSAPTAALALLLLAATAMLAPPSALAQEGEAPATATAEGGGGGFDTSFLRLMITSTGPIGVVLLLMSFYLIALVAWMYFEYRRVNAIPERLTRDLGTQLMQRQFSSAFERVSGDPSFLGRVLTAGVRKLPGGQPAAVRAMQMVNDDVTMEMEHRTAYLATVGTLGPLIGLFGTVYGMIVAFRAMSAAGQPEASLLAGGISTALFATLMGIGVAIPAITFYAVFRNRISRLSLEVELAAESLLEQFAPGVRPPHPLAPGGGGGSGGGPMPMPPQPPPFRTSLGGPKEGE